MRTHFLKASAMLVGVALLTTVATGCQGSNTAFIPIPSDAPIGTQPTTPADKPESGTTSITPPYSSEQQFDLINGTSLAMSNFYAEPSELTDWGSDELGDYALMPDEVVTININDNRQSCTYDFSAVFEDGSELQVEGINICELSSYTFTN